MEIAFLARRFVPSYREGGGDRIYSQPRESIRIPRTYLSFCRAVPHPPTVPRPRNYDATLWIKRIKVVVEEVLYEEVVARRVWNWIAKRSSDYLIALRFFLLTRGREGVRANNFVGETMKSNRNVEYFISHGPFQWYAKVNIEWY